MPGVRLGMEERQAIEVALAREEPFVTMALRLHRPTSTVSREVNANGGRGGYQAMAAQRASNARARRPKVLKLVANAALAAALGEGLAKRWSPGQVAARLVVDHPDDEAMRVSHETIYQALYLQGRGGLKRELPDRSRTLMAARKPARAKDLLGPLEAEVMAIMWARAAMVDEVTELLNGHRRDPLSRKTVLTILTRLETKGLLRHHQEGRAYRYSATMTEPEFVAEQAARAAGQLLRRFGDLAVSGFVDRVAEDPERLARLEELLEEHHERAEGDQP